MARFSYGSIMLVSMLCPLFGEEDPEHRRRAPGRRVVPAGSQSSHYFGRGLDLGEGADFAYSLDGIPLNLPSALQGPGFMDDGCLIPETVDGQVYRKGPYRAGQGAFAVAGSTDMQSVERFDRPMLKLEYGGAASDRFGRVLWAASPEDGIAYALEANHSYRPWHELWQSGKVNGFLRIQPKEPSLGWTFTAVATSERADGGSPPPDRPLPADHQEDFQDLRLGNGYQFQRLFLGLKRPVNRGAGVSDHFQLYGGASAMLNWSNNTYTLNNPDWGDQQEQVDRRYFAGGEARRQWELETCGVAWQHRLGVQGRVDEVGEAEVYGTFNRERKTTLMQARARLLHAAIYGQSTAWWGEGWHAFVAGRVDTQKNHVFGSLPWQPQSRMATLVSPRLGVGYSPFEDTEIRVLAGQGFRLGNALRDTRPMIRSRNAEVSAQTRFLPAWETGLTLWLLDLEHESLWDAQQSAPLLQGPSRRRGLEWYNEVKSGPWHAEVCLGWSRARFTEAAPGQDRVPGSIPQTGVVTLGWKHPQLEVALTFKSLGTYALTADNTVCSGRRNALELKLKRHWHDWSAAVKVYNAFNLRTNTDAFFYTSRLPGEEGPTGGTHTKHGDPQAIRLEVCRRF